MEKKADEDAKKAGVDKKSLKKGYETLAKQLTKMADSLPLLKSCMYDVK